MRAPTPTAAAELASPAQEAWLAEVRVLETRLSKLMRDRVRQLAQYLDWLSGRIVHPHHRIQMLELRLHTHARHMIQAQQAHVQRAGTELLVLSGRLWQHSPVPRLQSLQLHGRHLATALQRNMTRALQQSGAHLTQLMRSLHALSPLATLERGYAIVLYPATGTVVREAMSVKQGEQVRAKLAHGSLDCVVKERHED